MTVAHSIQQSLRNASWIRKMFEAGQTLKEELGADAVYDFSLGNPVLDPPRAFQRALQDLVSSPPPGLHGYMPNAGHLSTRRAVARLLSDEHRLPFEAGDVVMTVGAAGALNATLHSILDPADEVLILSPYFVEYLFYVQNHQGVPKIVPTTESFDPDIDAIDRAVTDRTKALIINTPNNPTGRVYTRQQISDLAAMLARHERRLGRAIYLIADTPYARITYDGHRNPPLFADHPNTILNHSHSKDLGLAGERIGYLAISPRAIDRLQLREACVFSNRVLGFINAPSLMQLAMERSIGTMVDMKPYIDARTLLCRGLREAGYDFIEPEGAFYLFPRTPIEDDVAFAGLLRERAVLVVPGRGFGRPGHIRIAYCVPTATIENALPHFAAAVHTARQTTTSPCSTR